MRLNTDCDATPTGMHHLLGCNTYWNATSTRTYTYWHGIYTVSQNLLGCYNYWDITPTETFEMIAERLET